VIVLVALPYSVKVPDCTVSDAVNGPASSSGNEKAPSAPTAALTVYGTSPVPVTTRVPATFKPEASRAVPCKEPVP